MHSPVATGDETRATVSTQTPPGTEPSATRRAFRKDVEGLRFVAIVLVAAYHIWSDRVSGGVDVFLFVSGFFVGGGLVRRFVRNAAPEPRAYAARLFWRLAPASAVTLAAVTLATVVLLPRTTWQGNAEQVFASMTYWQNVWLELNAEPYGAAGAGRSPLQHYWSLAIQGQLFIAVPVVLFAVRRWAAGGSGTDAARRYLHVIVLLFAASLTYATVRQGLDGAAPYYDTLARAWEYLAGTLTAMLVARLSLGHRARAALGALGLGALLACGLLLDGAALFPGPAALLPVGAAAAIIVAGHTEKPGPVNRLLATRAVAAGGRYAYGLYLWHWPILVFTYVVTGWDRVGVPGGLAIIAASLLLSVLVTRLLETPVRREVPVLPPTEPAAGSDRGLPTLVRARPSSRAARAVTLALVLSVVLTSGGLVVSEVVLRATERRVVELNSGGKYPGAAAGVPDSPGAAPEVPTYPSLERAAQDWSPVWADECLTNWSDVNIVRCEYGDVTSSRTVALVGGSHSDSLFGGFDVLGDARSFKLVTYLKKGCPYPGIFGDDNPEESQPSCIAWSEAATAALIEDKPDVVVVITSRHDEADASEYLPSSYVGAWRELADAGLTVLGVRDYPRWPVDPVTWAIDNEHGAHLNLLPRHSTYLPQSPASSLTSSPLAAELDIADLVCNDSVCPAVIGNVLVYRDSSHFTHSFATTLAPVLDGPVGAVTGWW